MSRRLAYLFLLLLVVVFIDGLVHIAIVSPWLAALLIASIACGIVMLARDVSGDPREA